jgi:hypothetical protein
LNSETQGLPLANAHNNNNNNNNINPQQPPGMDEDDDQLNQHPRNRWRCMQPRLCNYCWKTFSNSFNLKQHIVNVHIQSQGVTCTLCSKVVKNKWYLRKHLVTAHGAPLKRVKPETTLTSGKKSGNGMASAKKPLDMSLATAMAMAGGSSVGLNGDSIGNQVAHRVATSEDDENDDIN